MIRSSYIVKKTLFYEKSVYYLSLIKDEFLQLNNKNLKKNLEIKDLER